MKFLNIGTTRCKVFSGTRDETKKRPHTGGGVGLYKTCSLPGHYLEKDNLYRFPDRNRGSDSDNNELPVPPFALSFLCLTSAFLVPARFFSCTVRSSTFSLSKLALLFPTD